MTEAQHLQAILRLGDDALVLGQRLSEWCGHGPILEEDIALTNVALDLIGQARNLYTLAGNREGQGRDEDALAYFRTDREFQNHLLVEQPNGHFGDTVVRQMFYDAFALERYSFLARQTVDPELAGIAAKAVKELQYHWGHSSQWVIRLGDGTEESHAKVQESVNALWGYTGEMFMADDVDAACAEAGLLPDLKGVQRAWSIRVADCLSQATLSQPEDGWMQSGGKQGIHSEHLSYMLAEMQVLPRTYPNASW
jgi:ring-1,2-phenylacetyl-CoA epoxidase subunit PaaC